MNVTKQDIQKFFPGSKVKEMTYPLNGMFGYGFLMCFEIKSSQWSAGISFYYGSESYSAALYVGKGAKVQSFQSKSIQAIVKEIKKRTKSLQN